MEEIDIRRYKNPRNGRKLIYRLLPGGARAEDVIIKFLEIPPDSPGASTSRITLPANYINCYHRYQRGVREKDDNGNIRGIPYDEDGEEDRAFRLLYMEANVTSPHEDVEPVATSECAAEQATAGAESSLESKFDKLSVNCPHEEVRPAATSECAAKQTIPGAQSPVESPASGSKDPEADVGATHPSSAEAKASEVRSSADSQGLGEPVGTGTDIGHTVTSQEDRTQDTQGPEQNVQDDSTDSDGQFVPAHTTPWRPSRFLLLPWTVRSRILKAVLRKSMLCNGVLCIEDLNTPLPPIFHVCRQLRFDSWLLWSKLPLHVLKPLHRDTDAVTRKQRDNIHTLFGTDVSAIRLHAHVIHHSEATTFENFVLNVMSPSLNPGSRLLYLHIPAGGQASLRVYSAWNLLSGIRQSMGEGVTLYETSFAVMNHATLFGWLQYAGLKWVTDLTIRANGVDLWNDRPFGVHLAPYRSLPVIALIASIIAFKPSGLNVIRVEGLGEFCEFVKEMWQDIPERTPLTGVGRMLDQLVAYPFAESFPDVEEVRMDANGQFSVEPWFGNLFGITSWNWWQVMILRARHHPRSPRWEFYP